MKTTVDLPDALLHEAKVFAAQRRTSLKALLEEGLEYVLYGTSRPKPNGGGEASHDEFFQLDKFNVPVLRKRGAKVSENWVDAIRDEENI